MNQERHREMTQAIAEAENEENSEESRPYVQPLPPRWSFEADLDDLEEEDGGTHLIAYGLGADDCPLYVHLVLCPDDEHEGSLTGGIPEGMRHMADVMLDIAGTKPSPDAYRRLRELVKRSPKLAERFPELGL